MYSCSCGPGSRRARRLSSYETFTTPWHACPCLRAGAPPWGVRLEVGGRDARWFGGIPALRPPKGPRQVTLSTAAWVTLGVCSPLSCGPSDGCEAAARCRFNLHSLATGVEHRLLLELLRSPPFAHFPAGLFGFFLLIRSSRCLYVAFYFVFTCLELILKYTLASPGVTGDAARVHLSPDAGPPRKGLHGRPAVWVRIARRGDRQGKALPRSFLTTFLAVLGHLLCQVNFRITLPRPIENPVGLGL